MDDGSDRRLLILAVVFLILMLVATCQVAGRFVLAEPPTELHHPSASIEGHLM